MTTRRSASGCAMAISRAAALALLVLVAACSSAPAPAPSVVAPTPKVYSCAQKREISIAYDALPANSPLRWFIGDAIELIDKTRAALALPRPPRCPP